MLGGIFNKGDSSSSSSSGSSGGERRVPRPIAQIPELKMSPERLRAYEAAIEGVLDRPELELLVAKIIAYFVEQKIPLFDYRETYDYLTDRQTFDEGHKRWHWAHINAVGKPKAWGYDTYPKQPGYHDNTVTRHFELIPIRILRIIRELQERFGERLTFYVSRNGSSQSILWLCSMIICLTPIPYLSLITGIRMHLMKVILYRLKIAP
ncbi:MAG: hypothetical protein UZ21_OP11001000319 [Microgenomates bacterium OLB22]|nr:MAG: hypothetical protein UZ21_OP11001000319 [Microgenomates bacterium OLB22]